MESISDIIQKMMKSKRIALDNSKIRREVLTDSNVQAFLNAHKDELNKDIIDNSISVLYQYANQLKNPDQIMHGYMPKLSISSNTISLTYAPTNEKRRHDLEIQSKKRIKLIDLPNSLKDVKLSDYEKTAPRQAAILATADFIKNYLHGSHAKGLYFEGDFGVGKTYLLAGIANYFASKGINIAFLHVPTYIANLNRHFGKNTLNDEIDQLSTVPILIFDDIGAETLSEWARDDVFGVILQKRMDNSLSTFFSSNLSMNDLEKHFADTKVSYDELKAQRLMQRVRFLAREIFIGGECRRI